MDQKPPAAPDEADDDALNQPSTTVEGESSDAQNTGVISAESDAPIPVGPPPKPSAGKQLINKLFGFNIYLFLFIFVLIIAGVIVLFSYNYSKKKAGTATVNTTALSQDTLDKLAGSDTTVGSSSQVLNVQSSAVFAGKVLARSDLEVAGNLQIGGALNIPSITVSENANFGQVTISKNLAVTGDSAVQGAATIAKSLQVAGGGTFNGPLSAPQITTNTLQLNGDFVLTKHFLAGGGTPARLAGTALGNGGSVSVSGSDNAGSVSINTGGGPAAGCFVTVNFTTKYSSLPHVLVTPIGADAGPVEMYVTRTTSSFSICTSNAAAANASFGYDYFVIG